MPLRRAVFLLMIAAGAGSATCAWGQAPITTLPRPAGDTDPPPETQQQTPTYQPYVPAVSVHPITSLPKPPGGTSYPATTAEPAYAPAPYTVPAPVVDTTPAVSPAVTAPAPSTGVKGPVYVQPNSSSIPTAAPPIVAPQPTIDSPLHASTAQEVVAPSPVLQEGKKMRTFSTVAVQAKVGTGGIGGDIATPLTEHLNLRVGGSFFSYTGSYNDSGDIISGTGQLLSGSAYVDYYPWSHRSFRLSVGAVYNGNRVEGTTLVTPGTEFDLGDDSYYSSATDPVHGLASFNFGKKYAPSFTLGFGNMIPRSGKHLSFPFEIGFAYVGNVSINLTLQGSVCDKSAPPNCQKIDNDPQAQASLAKEISDINGDIRFLKFYPIVSQGISFRF